VSAPGGLELTANIFNKEESVTEKEKRDGSWLRKGRVKRRARLMCKETSGWLSKLV
jgi:hypothetical protein